MIEALIRTEVAVVGAGPAGLAAAVTAAEAGLQVALIDAGSQSGGQYWRHPDQAHPVADEGAGHHDWDAFTTLRARLELHVSTGRIRYLPNSQVWLLQCNGGTSTLHLTPTIDVPPVGAGAGGTCVGRPDAGMLPDLNPAPSTAGAPTAGAPTAGAPTAGAPSACGEAGAVSRVDAQELILCPGGYDRQLPIPGWDLPGVMAAGGVQALLKGNRTLAGKRAIVAGTGPFLLPVASGLAHAGATVAAICEANSPSGWLKNLRGALQQPGKALEAAEYAAALAKHRIPYRMRTAVTAIHGDTEVRSVTLARLDAQGRAISGTERQVQADLVALGWGFTPAMELVLSAGADTVKDVDGSLVAVVDDEQRSSVAGLRIAGEATGVGGARLAVQEGELAALGLAEQRGLPADASRMRRLKQHVRRARSFAVAMHRANPVPAHWFEWLTPETLVCRCEEVDYASVCAAHTELGAQEPRNMRSFARTGMGWCQSRVCGFATADIVAGLQGRTSTAEDLRPMAKRSLAAPVTLSRLASLGSNSNDSNAQQEV
jgi:NADP-dependent aldehyde dehydrogenase